MNTRTVTTALSRKRTVYEAILEAVADGNGADPQVAEAAANALASITDLRRDAGRH